MAITVDRDWRGWLGTYLLEVLCRESARRGIRNLRADILTCNGPMRTLARHRGEAYLPESDWQTVRVVFATSGSAPSWPSEPGAGAPERERSPRALVELRAMSFEALAEVAAAGFEARACAGRREGDPPCPMLDGTGDCALAADADVVVVAMPDDDRRSRLLEAHHDRHPEVPVVVVDRSSGPLRGRDLAAAAEQAIADEPAASDRPSER